VVILYKAARVVNFAHGELAIVGGYVFYSASLGGDSPWLAVAGALLFSVVMGVVIYMSMLRRLVGEPLHVAILVTIGIGIVLKSAILVIWRAERLTIDVGVAPAFRFAGGASLSYMDLASVALSILFFVALYLFLTFTRMGVQFRGTAENALLASQRGVNVDFVLSLAWVIAVLAASLSGVFFGSRAFLSTESVSIGLAGLVAALVGGLDSLRGAVAGAFIVAGAQYLTVRLIDPVLSETVPFLLLLLVMSIRPWGLFGTLEELDRV
jgi:branched-chain amino acid transport system permease protein